MYFRVRCDTGFTGASCQPRRRIAETMQADFGIRYEPDSDFVDIWGGEVIGGDKGCGTLLSGETLYFSDVSSPNYKGQTTRSTNSLLQEDTKKMLYERVV